MASSAGNARSRSASDTSRSSPALVSRARTFSAAVHIAGKPPTPILSGQGSGGPDRRLGVPRNLVAFGRAVTKVFAERNWSKIPSVRMRNSLAVNSWRYEPQQPPSVKMPRHKTSRSTVPPGCIDRSALLRSIVRDSVYVPPPRPGSFEVSYPEFLEYFRVAASLGRHHLIIAANFTYGWMPTILDFRSEGFDDAVTYLDRARTSGNLQVDELYAMMCLVNNSMVGASKLLHFVSPAMYAIWDRRVADYLGAALENGKRAAEQYDAYNQCCRSLSASPEMRTVTEHVSSVVGSSLGSIRALELVMLHGGLSGRSFRSDERS